MEDRLFRNLEFDQILEQIAGYAATEAAQKNIYGLEIQTNPDRLETMLDVLREAVALTFLKGSLPIGGYGEISSFAQHAQKGGVVREGGLLKIAAHLRTAKQVRSYIMPEANSNVSFPLLERIAEELEGLTPLEKEISRAILSENEISDHASSALYDIRKKMREANASVKDKLNQMIHSQQNKQYLQDAIVTIRNGRYVLPVKNEYKAQIQGIVHDSSGSGLTLFVEPMAIVNLNNRLRELEGEEQKEIERILKAFSEKVGAQSDILCNNERILIYLDECFAKAAYAVGHGHSKPEVSREKEVYLLKAFHPLIDKKSVVPSDLSIGKGYRQMVITGPNTGGKTVTLKTVGLCCLMMQCGLYIPAMEGSRLFVFDKIFVDIGDEQSIAQSLSTFSAHMKNLTEILAQVDENSLVLLDELGAGTDPSEGAALAWAILDRLRTVGAVSMATTHYNEIKQYALITEGVINASMEFDIENLKPTYRLQIGIPGKSNAFEISRRLGLDDGVLSAASDVLQRGNREYEDILAQLQNKLVSASDSYDEAETLASKNKALNEKLSQKEEEFRVKRDRLLTDAAVEAKQMLLEARAKAKEILNEADRYAKYQDSRTVAKKNEITSMGKEALERVNRRIPKHQIEVEDDDIDFDVTCFQKGDDVTIPDLHADGVILSLDESEAKVQVGAIKTKIALSKLKPKKRAKQKQYSYTGMKASSVSAKLDIRGITSTEVPLEVEKYLDDAMLAGLKSVTIVHGKGNGILRKAVEETLKKSSFVETYRIGGLREGGEGATIVQLS